MKSQLVFAACAAFAFASSAVDLTPGPDGCIRDPDGSLHRFTPEERKKLPREVVNAMGREFFRTTFGPKVEKPGSAKGYFKFVNCSKRVTNEDLQGAIKPINKYSQIRLEAVSGEAPALTSAKDSMKKYDANAAVFVVDSDTLPRLMLAPEDGWAVVNATALAADNPAQTALVKRVNIELARAFTFICGSATDGRSVLMGPVSELKDVDAIPSPSFLPLNLKQTSTQLSMFGIQPRIITTYKKACEEGWAYAPTNDVEKAIWDKAHETPSKPMKIKYDPKAKK